MCALRILLRHRVTSCPSWGTGTVAGQIVLLALLVLLLFPLGLFGYVLGDVLRELYPDASALRLINGAMLYLVPALTASRFFLQSPPSERVAPYVSLPISRTRLLHGQAALSLLSLHTLFAVVLVGPVWAGEVVAAVSPVKAAAWLASALLLAVVLPSYGANLLHLLLGRRPRWLLAGLAGSAGLFAVDALAGPDLFRTASRFVFGAPAIGLVVTTGATGATYAALFRTMQVRLEVDRRTSRRIGGPSRWGRAAYRWVAQNLPAGPLVALELRQILRTRRLRGMTLYTLFLLACLYLWGIASILFAKPPSDSLFFIIACTAGIPGPSLGLGPIIFGASSSHADGLFTEPHRLQDLVVSKLVSLWICAVPGTVLLLIISSAFPVHKAGFLAACVVWWWGITIPGFVWIGLYIRKPVDLSASHFSFRNDFHALPALLLAFLPMTAFTIADGSGIWWRMSAGMGGLGLVGLLVHVWTQTPLASGLDRNRYEMLKSFRENEPI